MAKPKGNHPNQPVAYNMLKYSHQNGSTSPNEPNFTHQNGSSTPHDSCQNDRKWESEGETNAAYSKLDNKLRDFIYGISRGYSVRHACQLSGQDYENMLDYLNSKNRYFKPDLWKLFQKAQGVSQARHIEEVNKATDWHAHAWWLERRMPREYAPPRAGIPLEDEERSQRKALLRMTPETIDALSQAYDAEHGTPGEEREATDGQSVTSE